MDQPLGAAVGNALEVREALETVRGHGPADFTELVLDACAQAARALRPRDRRGGGTPARRGRRSPTARAEATWRRWIEAQGGTADESALPRAPVVREVDGAAARATSAKLSAIGVGNAAVHLGAGRRTKEDEVDHAVGIVLPREAGRLRRGRRAARRVHARTEDDADARRREVLAAYEIADVPPDERPVLLDVVA